MDKRIPGLSKMLGQRKRGTTGLGTKRRGEAAGIKKRESKKRVQRGVKSIFLAKRTAGGEGNGAVGSVLEGSWKTMVLGDDKVWSIRA